VVFVPFGDIVAFSALTLASMQLGRMPGTVYLVATFGGRGLCRRQSSTTWRRGQPQRIGRGLVGYGVLPLIPAAIAWLSPPERACPSGRRSRCHRAGRADRRR
jgi:branched-chain amino acid transport system permease protein